MSIAIASHVAVLSLLFVSLNWSGIMYLLFARSLLDKREFWSFSLYASLIFLFVVSALLFFLLQSAEMADALHDPYLRIFVRLAPLLFVALQLLAFFSSQFTNFLTLPYFYGVFPSLLLINLDVVTTMLGLSASLFSIVAAVLLAIPFVCGLIWLFVKVADWASTRFRLEHMARVVPLGLLVYVLLLLIRQWLS